MYCENCHRENPENFETCIYCGTSLMPEKKAGFLRYRGSLREKVTPIAVFTSFAAICALLALIFSSYAVISKEHPEKVAFSYALSIENNDAHGYSLLLCDEYKRFKLKYVYYTQEEYDKELKSTLFEANEFYGKKCGDGFTVKCKVTDTVYADGKLIGEINSYCRENLFFEKEIEKAAKLKVTLDVIGKEGKYTTVIPDFICVKTDGLWRFIPDCPF